MRSTPPRRLAASAATLGTALLLAVPARAQGTQSPLPQGARHVVVDGDAWLQSSPEMRRAFLVGAGNMLALETAYAQKKGTPPSPASAMMGRALEHLSLNQVSDRVTRWYQANPARRTLPVVGVIWVDMVQPTATSR